MKSLTTTAIFVAFAMLPNQLAHADSSNRTLIDKTIHDLQTYPDFSINGESFSLSLQGKTLINSQTSLIKSEVTFIVEKNNQKVWEQSLEKSYKIKYSDSDKKNIISELNQTSYIEHEGWTVYSISAFDEKSNSVKNWAIMIRGGPKSLGKFSDPKLLDEIDGKKNVKIDNVSGIIVYLGRIEIADK